MTLAYAIHRLNGVATPASAAYSASELEFQIKSSGSKVLFTVSVSFCEIITREANLWKVCPSA